MISFTLEELLKKYSILVENEQKKQIKALLTAMEKNNLSYIKKQRIYIDEHRFNELFSIFNELRTIFDYKYNTRNDLEQFFDMIINEDSFINFYAIFCPGYTNSGYKDRLGHTTTSKIEKLRMLKDFCAKNKINCNMNCIYADIFLENCDNILNSNWKQELQINKELFFDFALKYFEEKEITFLSDIYPDDVYEKGFINKEILIGKGYNDFMKYNRSFYEKMAWSEEQIKYRNDKLYTIYNIIANYIKGKNNAIYLPMENMYARTKVFTKKGVCSMYFNL